MKLAKEIMVTRLVRLGPQTPAHTNIKGAPVIDEDRNYPGIFAERCCLRVLTTLCENRSWANFSNTGTIRSCDFMNQQLWMLQAEMDVYDAVNFLLAHRMAGAPVVDEHGRYLGCSRKRTA